MEDESCEQAVYSYELELSNAHLHEEVDAWSSGSSLVQKEDAEGELSHPSLHSLRVTRDPLAVKLDWSGCEWNASSSYVARRKLSPIDSDLTNVPMLRFFMTALSIMFTSEFPRSVETLPSNLPAPGWSEIVSLYEPESSEQVVSRR